MSRSTRTSTENDISIPAPEWHALSDHVGHRLDLRTRFDWEGRPYIDIWCHDCPSRATIQDLEKPAVLRLRRYTA